MPDVIITPSSGIIDFFPGSTRVGRIDGSGNTINVINPSGFVAVSGSGLSINTVSPNATLHAYSATSGATLFNLEGTNGSLFSVVDNLSGSLMSVNNNAGLPVFEVFSDDRIIGGRFGQSDWIVTSGGNIGIGTGVPSSKFHVVGTSTFGGDILSTGSFIAGSGSAANPSFEFNGDADTGMFSPSGNVLAFSTSGVERLRINNIGNVGIGTTTPSGHLDVAGDVYIRGTGNNLGTAYFKSQAVGDKTLYVGATNGGDLVFNGGGANIQLSSQGGYLNVLGFSTQIHVGHAYDAGNTSQTIRFLPAAKEMMRMTTSGTLGIGLPTSSSSYAGNTVQLFSQQPYANTRVHIAGSGANSGSAALIVTNSGISPILYVRNDGNVGIGTITPSGQLHVAGTGIFDSGLYVNNTSVSLSGHTHQLSSITDVTSSATEVNYLDGSIPGTGVAGKAIVLDNNSNISNLANINTTGTITSGKIIVDNITLDNDTISSSGILILNPGTGSALQRDSGGYPRGIYATDLQAERASITPSMVAYGPYSVIAGGAFNTAYASYSNILGGYYNSIGPASVYSSILGGCCNTTNSYQNVFILGSNIIATQSNTTFTENLISQSGQFTSLSVNNIGINGNMVFATNSNGNLIIKPNGNGSLQADNAGNSRGIYSVDLQRDRSSASGVASGGYSVVAGGYNNTASGDFSTINGGKDALSSLYGEDSRSSGKFNQPGDAQVRRLISRNTVSTSSTGITSARLYLDGQSLEITIPDNATWFFTIKIVAKNTTYTESAAYKIEGVVEKSPLDTLLLVENVTTIWEDFSLQTANVSISSGGDKLQIEMTLSPSAVPSTWYIVAYTEIVQLIASPGSPSY